MSSTSHTAAALTALQAKYTVEKNTVTAMTTAGVRSAAAASAATQQELQLVTTREGASALT